MGLGIDNIFIFLLFLLIWECKQEVSPNHMNFYSNELFGNGQFDYDKERDDENETSKHQSSSIEDLILLFKREKELIRYLNDIKKSARIGPGAVKLIDSYFKDLDYDLYTYR